MLIIMRADATQDQIDHVVARIEVMGLKAHLSRGTERTIIGAIGDGRPRRALRGIARDQGREFGELDEIVGLSAQLIGHHRRRRLDGADDRDPQTAALHGLDQPAEVAVAGEQDHMVQMLGHLQDVDGELDVHVALDLAAAHGVGEFLGRLRHHGVAVVIQPVDQRPDRRTDGNPSGGNRGRSRVAPARPRGGASCGKGWRGRRRWNRARRPGSGASPRP